MPRLILPLLISGLSLSLAACSSVPSQDRLVTGIDKTQLTQGTTSKRAASDPVCVEFYSNVEEYEKEAADSKNKRSFFNRLGLNVASSVALGQIDPGIGNRTAQIATRSAAGTVTSTGKQVALRELNSSDRADAKIIEVAGDIGCPVNIKP